MVKMNELENKQYLKRSILAIGDPMNTIISYRDKMYQHSTFLANNGVKFIKIDYSLLEKGLLPDLQEEQILPILFFPQRFRDENIDSWIIKDGIFGGNTHLEEIDKYYFQMGKLVEEKYGSRVKFLNSPETIKNTRDKRKLKKILLEEGIPTAKQFHVSSAEELLDLSFKTGIYVKLPGWGYGQGITQIKEGHCRTNLVWDGSKINPDPSIVLSHPIEISNPASFLSALLNVDPIVEEEIDFISLEEKKFDLRLYLVGNPFLPNSVKVPFWFPRVNAPEELVTNWSRGGEIRYDSIFRDKINSEALKESVNSTLKLAKRLNLNYGGVDIMFNKKWDPLFIEAQTDCGLPNPKQFDLLLYTAQRLIES